MGGRVVFSGDSLLTSLQTGLIDGSIATSIESKRNYLLTGSVWKEQNPVGFKTYYIVPTGGLVSQSLIGLSGYSFNTGYGAEMSVYYNGTLQMQDSTPSSRDFDYHLSGSNSTGVRFNYSLPSGGLISFVNFR